MRNVPNVEVKVLHFLLLSGCLVPSNLVSYKGEIKLIVTASKFVKQLLVIYGEMGY